MEEINFFWEDIEESTLPNHEQTQQWIQAVIKEEKSSLIALNFIFCNDEFLLRINQEYLNHDTYTDIITFDHSENGLELEGDIFISVERVRENAQNLQIDFLEELKRVIIHGVLHLIGYADKSPEDIQEMRAKEDFYIAIF